MTISLIPLTEEHHDRLFAWESDPGAVEMAAFTPANPRDRAAFDAHRAKIAADPTVRQRAIEQAGEFVGSIATFTIEGERELTYWIDPARWGGGIATEAVRLMCELEPERPLYARVAEGNLGSRRVLERNGFVETGEERAYAAGRAAEITEWIFTLAPVRQ